MAGRTLTLPTPDQHDDAKDRGAALSEQFVTWVAEAQRPLHAYIRTLLAPWADAEDVLQEVNLVLCRKAHEFDGRGRFLTWACRIAYFQVLAHLKERQRRRGVYFDEAVLDDLAGPLAEQVDRLDGRMDALRHCLEQLPPEHRRLITARYASGGSVQRVAEEEGRPAGSIRVTLHRLRMLLLGCIERRLAAEGLA